jgi:hypothetical protein
MPKPAHIVGNPIHILTLPPQNVSLSKLL